MEENFEVNHSSEGTQKNSDSNKKLTGGIISLVLILFAVIIVFVIVNNRLSAGGTETGGWVGGRGSCCSVGAAASSEDQLALSGLDYYGANFGDTEGLEATVDDFGCHQEISIHRNGEVIRRLSYSNGNFYDITP